VRESRSLQWSHLRQTATFGLMGLPFLLSGDLQSASTDWKKFHRLTISQDTGSAIVGRARGDFFVGSGEQSGAIASLIRHELDFIALLPKAAMQ